MRRRCADPRRLHILSEGTTHSSNILRVTLFQQVFVAVIFNCLWYINITSWNFKEMCVIVSSLAVIIRWLLNSSGTRKAFRWFLNIVPVMFDLVILLFVILYVILPILLIMNTKFLKMLFAFFLKLFGVNGKGTGCPKNVLLSEKSPTFHKLADLQKSFFFCKQIMDQIIFKKASRSKLRHSNIMLPANCKAMQIALFCSLWFHLALKFHHLNSSLCDFTISFWS